MSTHKAPLTQGVPSQAANTGSQHGKKEENMQKNIIMLGTMAAGGVFASYISTFSQKKR